MLKYRKASLFFEAFLFPILLLLFSGISFAGEMKAITGGEYLPLYLKKGSPLEQVNDFHLDEKPVSNKEYFEFTQANKKWNKQNIASIFAEENYLRHWKAGQPSKDQEQQAVINISWFAAQAYCETQNKRLPTVAEWEFVARASPLNINGVKDPKYQQKILAWYSRPTQSILPKLAQGEANIWGIYDMHGMVWEWTFDFNSALVSGESRADGTIDQSLFCGAGSAGATNPEDYAAFMRYGFRSSLNAKFTLQNLGFRCARDKHE